MTPAQVDAVIRHAQRCRTAWESRFTSVAAVDSWAAGLRDVADMVDLTLGDPADAATLVGTTLVVDAMSVEMLRDPGIVWTPVHHDVAVMPLRLTAALAAPYLGVRS